MPNWLRLIVAVAIALLILWVGVTTLRGVSTGPPARRGKEDAEEVEALDVYLVCRECGTEFKVTRLGELSVPRHCGEPMDVVRRPAVESRPQDS